MRVASEYRSDKTATLARPKPLIVSEDESARICGVSKPTFRAWVRAGLISPVDLPTYRKLYRVSDLTKFVAGLSTRAPEDAAS